MIPMYEHVNIRPKLSQRADLLTRALVGMYEHDKMFLEIIKCCLKNIKTWWLK